MNTIQKTIVALTLTLAASMAHANLFNNDVEATEVSSALLHCVGPAHSLLRTEEAYISSVIGQHTKNSDRVDSKTYTFTSKVGGAFGGPPAETVAELTVTATVTQSDYSAPSSVTWKCVLSN
jgi:hypothetical protein